MCVVSSETPARLRRPELRAGRHSAGAGRDQRPEASDALAAVHRARCPLAARLHRDHQQRHAALRQRFGKEARCAALRQAPATLASRLAAYVRIRCRGTVRTSEVLSEGWFVIGDPPAERAWGSLQVPLLMQTGQHHSPLWGNAKFSLVSQFRVAGKRWLITSQLRLTWFWEWTEY